MNKEYTVDQVVSYIKRMITSDYMLSNISVKGTVSDVSYPASGNVFFTLENDDKSAVIACTMFRSSRAGGLKFKLEAGQSVVVSGRISIYEKKGNYQLIANEVNLAGLGDFYVRFEQIKKELAAKGLFDEAHKKPIPKYALRIGVVTSRTGAVIQDIKNVTARRNPYVRLYLYPSLVEGDGAASTIVKGINALDRLGLDVIIIGRGGGSINDLWAFNDEELAYTIYNADTPIISGTGHEVDYTIADYVADLRAPTPSAAAELAVFRWEDYLYELSHMEEVLNQRLTRRVKDYRAELDRAHLRLNKLSPMAKVAERKHLLQDMKKDIEILINDKVKLYKEQVADSKKSLDVNIKQLYDKRYNQVSITEARLKGLSPLDKLINGFGYVSVDDKPVKDITKLNKGDRVTLTMSGGSRDLEVVD